jgi:hypothetical protein
VQPTYLPSYLHTCKTTYLPTWLRTYIPTYLPPCTYSPPTTYNLLPACLSVCLSVGLRVCQSVCLSVDKRVVATLAYASAYTKIGVRAHTENRRTRVQGGVVPTPGLSFSHLDSTFSHLVRHVLTPDVRLSSTWNGQRVFLGCRL